MRLGRLVEADSSALPLLLVKKLMCRLKMFLTFFLLKNPHPTTKSLPHALILTVGVQSTKIFMRYLFFAKLKKNEHDKETE